MVTENAFLSGVATFFSLLAGILFYISSPKQIAVKTSSRPRLYFMGACVTLLISLALFLSAKGKAASCFMVIVLLMISCSLLPFVISIVKHNGSSK